MYSKPLDSFIAVLEVVCVLFIPVFIFEEVSELIKVTLRSVLMTVITCANCHIALHVHRACLHHLTGRLP
jgi:hypothetical protein